jgi:histone-lysine N-methyltransferase SETMAR
MHIDNAIPHNSALSLQKSEELRFTRLAPRPYSPDLAPCDFFLLGYLKTELHGKNFRSQNEVISMVRAF